MDYRTKETVKIITFPAGFEEENRGEKGCCICKQLVLASSTSNDSYKNDVRGVYLKKADPSDTASFEMYDSTGTQITNYGTTPIFPFETNVVAFIYSWKEILQNEGAGCYTIKAVFNIAGIEGGYTVGVFDLKEYSVYNARGTVKVHSKFNSYYQKDEVDFTDSNFADSIRFNGYFGDRQPDTQINNLIGKKRKVEKVTRENLNKLGLRTDPVSICVTRRLVDFHLLNENEILLSDHNKSNHDYLIFDKPMIVSESAEFEYIEGSRLAKVSCTLSEKDLLDKSYYTT